MPHFVLFALHLVDADPRDNNVSSCAIDHADALMPRVFSIGRVFTCLSSIFIPAVTFFYVTDVLGLAALSACSKVNLPLWNSSYLLNVNCSKLDFFLLQTDLKTIW